MLERTSSRRLVIGQRGFCVWAGGAGKTRAGAEWVRQLAERGKEIRIGILGATASDFARLEPACLRAEQEAIELAVWRDSIAVSTRGSKVVRWDHSHTDSDAGNSRSSGDDSNGDGDNGDSELDRPPSTG